MNVSLHVPTYVCILACTYICILEFVLLKILPCVTPNLIRFVILHNYKGAKNWSDYESKVGAAGAALKQLKKQFPPFFPRSVFPVFSPIIRETANDSFACGEQSFFCFEARPRAKTSVSNKSQKHTQDQGCQILLGATNQNWENIPR
jgi:hypothetical protein